MRSATAISRQRAPSASTVYGNLNVPEKVELTSTARVIGDITTNGLVIDEQAIFQGSCNMNQDTSKRPKPNRRAVKEMQKEAKSAISDALKDAESASAGESDQS